MLGAGGILATLGVVAAADDGPVMVDAAEVFRGEILAAGAQLEVPAAMVIVDADVFVRQKPAYLIEIGFNSRCVNLHGDIAAAARFAKALADVELIAISGGLGHCPIPKVVCELFFDFYGPSRAPA